MAAGEVDQLLLDRVGLDGRHFLFHEQFLEQLLAKPLPVSSLKLADVERRGAAHRRAARRRSPAAWQSRSTQTASA